MKYSKPTVLKREVPQVARKVPAFTDMMRRIDINTFIRMAMKSGMTGTEQRDLVQAFRNLK